MANKFYSLRNDYMFHSVLQESENVLRGLVSALIGIDPEAILSCTIENPIVPGEHIDDKTTVLDVKLLLNHAERVNIEMQVEKRDFWTARSLLYWARAYDRLKKGEDYGCLKKTYHIGILDYTLFPEEPEFLSEYLIVNKVTQRIYNDNFCIRTVDLTQIDRYREGEEELAAWARLFRANSWEELEQLAAGKEVYQEMVVTMKKLTAEERMQMELEAREDYERTISSLYKSGHRNGMQEGMRQGEIRINQLYSRLMEEDRMEDMRRAVREPVYQQKLLQEFGL